MKEYLRGDLNFFALISSAKYRSLLWEENYINIACYLNNRLLQTNDLKMVLRIKNMVSLRCKIIVRTVLECLDVRFTNVDLGLVETCEELNTNQVESVRTALGHYGLELMEDRESIICEKIRNTIVEMIHYNEEPPAINFSSYLSEKLHYDYHYLSNLFSKVKGVTIEQFIIAHKIERVKMMMMYNELTLTEIAYRLHYSNVAHLSNQFKKVTGITPSEFRRMKHKKLTALENI